MIGVVVSEHDTKVAEEFFELFKTPWEWAVPGKKYRVLLVSNAEVGHVDADLVIAYGARECRLDHEMGICVAQMTGPVSVEWQQGVFPIYGEVGHLSATGEGGVLKVQGRPVDSWFKRDGRIIWRIAYDICDEIRFLLTEGQSIAHAHIPTVECHIAILRYVMILCKIPFLEIPPRPHGYDFMCCLTHDVDFFGIRRHLFDRTMAGFLYRASVGTLIDLVRGRRLIEEAYKNWLAVLSLPMVFLRIVPDFWRPFDDYAKVEDRKRSTFFLVPFKGRAGVAPNGMLNKWRATPYGIEDVQEDLGIAVANGSELAVHGIDAWHKVESGREELNALASYTGQNTTGIRMHWLYFDQESPGRLESAGYLYDSTCGFNETIGYRAGTAQVFRPLGCSKLMELPMAIMDSALFSSGRMGLSSARALQLANGIVENVKNYGGVLVVNWHERSLAPERLLGRAYRDLLDLIEDGNHVWFAQATEAVQWFRWRRSICFCATDGSRGCIKVSAPCATAVGGEVRIHRPDHAENDSRFWDGTTPIEVYL